MVNDNYPDKTKVFAILGNPGTQYKANRHNIGFMAGESLVREYSFPAFRRQAKFHAEISEGEIDGQKIILVKPLTYMNETGKAVAAILRHYHLPIEAVTVFQDELDLPLGKIRVKRGGGAGGHNGLRSIDALAGNNYRRVRLGIGHPGDKNRVADYVLTDFTPDERVIVQKLLDVTVAAMPELLRGDDAAFAQKAHNLLAA
ncbi:MAG: aminoacyl-tRNA hydrolase [Candidatus Symbiobacter sp.]|nr:aminoacyl-tRNA hydrolase [Candidatus Symbiobacter sp.]